MKSAALLAGAFIAAAALAQERPDNRLTERAHQDRDIVYFLQEPDTHAFKLYHDYTEAREGTDKYLNVVRPGSTVAEPSGRITRSNLTRACS